MRLVSVLLLAVMVSIGAAPRLRACGDKFLVLSRGTRFERPSLKRLPAAVALYAPPDSGLSRALAALPIQATLERAGYTALVAASRPALDEIIRRRVDLILLDLSEATTFETTAGTEAAPPLLPVVFGRKDTAAAQALKRFQCAVTSPNRNQSFLDAVDQALAAQRKAAEAAHARAH
jgi:hypothetical protein